MRASPVCPAREDPQASLLLKVFLDRRASAATPVHLVCLARTATRAPKVRTVSQASTARREMPASQAFPDPRDHLDHPDFPDKMDTLVLLEQRVTRATPDSRVFQAWWDSRENLVFLDSLVWTVPPGSLVFKETEENQVLSFKAKRANADCQVLRGYQVLRATQEPLVSQGSKEKLVDRVHRVLQDRWVLWDQRENAVFKVPRVCRVYRVHKVNQAIRVSQGCPAATTSWESCWFATASRRPCRPASMA